MGNGTSQPLCGSWRSPCHSQGNADKGGGPGPPPRAATEPCSCRPERTPVSHRQPRKSKDQQLPPTSSWRPPAPTSSWRPCPHLLVSPRTLPSAPALCIPRSPVPWPLTPARVPSWVLVPPPELRHPPQQASSRAPLRPFSWGPGDPQGPVHHASSLSLPARPCKGASFFQDH